MCSPCEDFLRFNKAENVVLIEHELVEVGLSSVLEITLGRYTMDSVPFAVEI